jgi:hypothetical protein
LQAIARLPEPNIVVNFLAQKEIRKMLLDQCVSVGFVVQAIAICLARVYCSGKSLVRETARERDCLE